MLIEPRSFGQVLADAVDGLGRTWRPLTLPALAASVPMTVGILAIFGITGGGDFLRLTLSNPEMIQTLPDEVFQRMARPFYIAMALATVLQVLFGVFIALASHRAVACQVAGQPTTSGSVAAHAIRRYPRGLASAGIALLAVAILLGLGGYLWLVPLLSVGTPTPASSLVALLLLAALVGPGIWAGVSVSMTSAVVALEEDGVVASIRRSMRLVKGRWWPTAGFLVLVGLLGLIAVQMIQLIAIPLVSTGSAGAALTVASLLGVAAQGLIIAAIAATYTHWYIDLRSRDGRLATDDLA